ncbi:MAG: hypothetical protein ACI4RV_08915, partial [Eubacteriales bacterium]
LFNDLYEKLVGRRSALDPLGIINDTVGRFSGYRLPNVCDFAVDIFDGDGISFDKAYKADNWFEGLLNTAEDIGGELPFLGGVLFGGGRVPISAAIPDIKKIGSDLTNENYTRSQIAGSVFSEIGKTVGANVLMPVGGGQVRKMLQGVYAAAKGGSYTLGSDGREKLQYAVINDSAAQVIGNYAKGIFFGKYSLAGAKDWVESGFKGFSANDTELFEALKEVGESDAMSLSVIQKLRDAEKTDDISLAMAKRDVLRDSGLSAAGMSLAYLRISTSDKEKELVASLSDRGADMHEAIGALMDIKDIEADEDAKGAAKSNAKRDVIKGARLTDGEKADIYRYVFSDSRDSEVSEFAAAGLSFDDFLEVQNLYTEIGETDMKATEKATEFFYRLDGFGYTKEQADVAKDCFRYYQMTPANASENRYERFVNLGINKDAAYDLAATLGALEPVDGKSQVSDVQRYRAVIDSALTEEEQAAAMGTFMDSGEKAKFEAGYSLGVTPTAYVLFKENASAHDDNGDGKLKNDEVTAIINDISGNGSVVLPGGSKVKKVSMTNNQKAILWQMITGSSSAKNNPFSVKWGEKYLKQKKNKE